MFCTQELWENQKKNRISTRQHGILGENLLDKESHMSRKGLLKAVDDDVIIITELMTT